MLKISFNTMVRNAPRVCRWLTRGEVFLEVVPISCDQEKIHALALHRFEPSITGPSAR
jgi:hypothetical protein